jgi:hypothetical protein
MAHFAKLDKDNNVLEVLVVNNEDIINEQGDESEELGIKFLADLTGHDSWKQSSFNFNFRKNHASQGYVYDEDLDAFYNPVPPYESWTFDSVDCYWKAPVPYPLSKEEMEDSEQFYQWSDLTQEWVSPKSEE